MTESDQLTLFAEDTHANRSALPGSDMAKKTTVMSGQRCSVLYRKSDQIGLLVKTLLDIYPWVSTKCYLTWKVRVRHPIVCYSSLCRRSTPPTRTVLHCGLPQRAATRRAAGRGARRPRELTRGRACAMRRRETQAAGHEPTTTSTGHATGQRPVRRTGKGESGRDNSGRR